MSEQSVNESTKWGSVWKRWMIWFFAFSVAYWVLAAVGFIIRGCALDGIVDLATGISGNMIFSVFISLIIALVQVATRWKFFPTTIKGGCVRSVVIGLAFGVLAAASNSSKSCATEQPQSQSTPIKQDVASCVELYRENKIQEALNVCRNVAYDNVPKLQSLRNSKNPKDIARLTSDEFDLTSTLAFIYRHNDESENAREAARHAVGWGLMYLGAVSEIVDKAQYKTKIEDVSAKIDQLDNVFSGVKEAETKQFQESFKGESAAHQATH